MKMKFGVLILSATGLSLAQNPNRTLSLNDCLRIALEKSPYAIQYKNTRFQVRTDIGTTASQLLPSVAVSADYAKSGPQAPLTLPSGIPSTGFIRQSRSSGTTSIGVSANLVNVPSYFSLAQSIDSYTAAVENFRGARADFVFNVKQAFYNLVRQYKTIAVAQVIATQSQEQVSVAQERLNLGALSRPDLLAFEVTLSQARVNLLNAQNGLVNAYEALANFLGITTAFTVDTNLAFPDTTVAMPSQDSLINLVGKENPQYKAAQEVFRAQQKLRLAAITRKVPSLTGRYTYGFSDTSFLGGIGNSQNRFWTTGISLTWDLIDGGAYFFQLRKLSSQLQSANASVVIAENTAITQMQQAVGNLRAARQTLSSVMVLLAQADEQYRLQVEKYRLGAASPLDILNSQVQFNQAHQSFTDAIVNYYLAQAQIRHILGEY